MMTPRCWERHCKHFLGVKNDSEEEAGERNYCEAFPDGIPPEIAYGEDPHTEPTPGQGNGIVYEKGKFQWED